MEACERLAARVPEPLVFVSHHWGALQCSPAAPLVFSGGGPERKYNRFTMGKRRELQCKALRRREKSRRRKNNGEQWKYNEKNNAQNNGNSRKSGSVRRPVVT